MRTLTWLPLCCGLLALPAGSDAQRTLAEPQLKQIVSTSMDSCALRASPAAIVPKRNAREIPQDRVAKTLHGIWRGRVTGAYPRHVLGKDNTLNVDYYWIIDMKRGEALIMEQLRPERSLPQTRTSRKGPTFSFLMCGEEGYLPRHPRQVHSFEKVSDDIEGAQALLQKSTGVRVAAATAGDGFSLSDAWKQIVGARHFEQASFPAFAAGLFKPFEIGTVESKVGPALVSLRYTAEYRGGGITAARFTEGTPIIGAEEAQFVGVAAPDGDYLVASFGNGQAWAKEATQGGVMELTFDKVVIGPLSR